jgi:hypothetical protein
MGLSLSIPEFLNFTFHTHNRQYFGGILPVPHFQIVSGDNTNRGAWVTSRNGVHTISIKADLLEHYPHTGAQRLISDYLLHEMVHIAAGTSEGHDGRWIDEISRITPLLGLPLPAAFTRFQAVSFPASLTHPSYYSSSARRQPGATVYLTEFAAYQLGVMPMPAKMQHALAVGKKLLIADIDAGNEGGFLDFRVTKQGVFVKLERVAENG